MIDLNELELAGALADELSLTRVAAQKGFSPGSVAGHIRRLERELGHPLFTRSADGLAATEAATLLVPRARRLLAEVDRARELAMQLRAGSVGRLRIGHVGHGFGPLTDALGVALSREMPDVNVSMVRIPLKLGVSALADPRNDVIVTSLPAQRSEPDMVVDAPFLTEPRVVVLREQDALANEGEILLEHLSQVHGDVEPPVLALGCRGGYGKRLQDYFGFLPAGLAVDPRSANLERIEDALNLVVHGTGVLLLPQGAARFYRRPGLTVRPFLDADACQTALVWRDCAEPTVASFRRVLADVAQQSRAVGGLLMREPHRPTRTPGSRNRRHRLDRDRMSP